MTLYYKFISSLFFSKFLSSQKSQLRLAELQSGSHELPALVGYSVIVGLGYFEE